MRYGVWLQRLLPLLRTSAEGPKTESVHLARRWTALRAFSIAGHRGSEAVVGKHAERRA